MYKASVSIGKYRAGSLIPSGYLTDERVEALKAQGVVFEKFDDPEPKAKEPTVAELRAVLDEAGVEYDPKAKKPELVALVAAIPPKE